MYEPMHQIVIIDAQKQSPSRDTVDQGSKGMDGWRRFIRSKYEANGEPSRLDHRNQLVDLTWITLLNFHFELQTADPGRHNQIIPSNPCSRQSTDQQYQQ